MIQDFRTLVRDEMDRQNMTVHALHQRMGKDAGTLTSLYNWLERGKTQSIHSRRLARIFTVLGLTVVSAKREK